MDEFIPFLVFIVIALINLVKFVLEKNAKTKLPSDSDSDSDPIVDEQPKLTPNSIESFFESLAEKIEPKPEPFSDWPEEVERPDYMQEAEAYEQPSPAPVPEPVAEIIPFTPAPIEVEPVSVPAVTDIQSTTQKMAMKSLPSSIASLKGSRLTSAPILRSGTAGSIDFPLRDKAVLKKAIIANIIFSPPRAFATDFENTIAK